MNDFENWLNELKLQTLTNELKDEILEKVTVVYQDAFGEGYGNAKHEIINHITYEM